MITWAVLPVMMRPLAPAATNDAFVRDDRGIDDLHAQACGAVGCAHDVANATQKLDDVLGKQVIEVCLRIG